jgi:hypothetical protein
LRRWPELGLRTGLRRRLRRRTVLRCWLRRGAVLGLRLTVLRLLWAELRPRLRLDGLNGTGLRLDGPQLRLLRLGGTVVRPGLKRGGAVVRVHWAALGLTGSYFGWNGSDLGLAGTQVGLTRSYFRLAGAAGLYLRPVVGFTRTIS